MDEAQSAYLRGRAAGADRETEADLGEITSRIEEGWSIFAGPIGRLEREKRMEILAIWEAFSRFARTEVGVEPKTLIKAWFGPMLPEIEAVEDTLGSKAMNPKKQEEYESMLLRLWSELVP